MNRTDPSTAVDRDAFRRFSVALLAAVLLTGPIGCEPDVERPSPLILLTVDTLRSDRVGAFGGKLGLTPNLDALADESIVFTSTYAPSSFTVPSVSSMMTGRYPLELGIWLNESGLPEATPTLARELKRRGWRTFAVIGNFVLRRESGLDAGFDHYDDSFRDREAVRGVPERKASETTNAGLSMIDWCLEGGDSRCLVWIHYQDPHGPYTPPEGLRERYLPIEREATDGLRNLPVKRGANGIGGIPKYQYIEGQREVAFYRAGYDAEVSYLDAEIGRLIEGLEERGLMETALIVFAADHGEALGEKNYWFAHGEFLGEVLVRVPFFMRVPGRPPARRSDVVSLVDLYGTVLRQLIGRSGIPDHRGRDLLAEGAEDRATVPYLDTRGAPKKRRYGIVDGNYKWIVSADGDVSNRTLFRIDPSGTAVQTENPDVERAMSEQLDQLMEGFDRSVPEVRQRISDKDRAMLRALGYAEETPDPAGESP